MQKQYHWFQKYNKILNDEFKTVYNQYLAADSVDERHEAELEIYAFALNKGLVTNTEQAIEERGLVTIRQWSEDAENGFPLARIGLAMVEVALEYITTNPGIFGITRQGQLYTRTTFWGTLTGHIHAHGAVHPAGSHRRKPGGRTPAGYCRLHFATADQQFSRPDNRTTETQ